MHAAPPVRIDLVPDRAAAWAVRLLAAAAAANVAVWLGAAVPWRGWALAAVGLAAAVAAAGLATRLLRGGFGCAGVLAWDGLGWSWTTPGAPSTPVRPRSMLDGGSGLLLRLQPLAAGEAVRWGVARSSLARGAWSAWRAALQATPETAPDPARTAA